MDPSPAPPKKPGPGAHGESGTANAIERRRYNPKLAPEPEKEAPTHLEAGLSDGSQGVLLVRQAPEVDRRHVLQRRLQIL